MMRFVSLAILCAMGSTPVLACERPSAPSSSKEDMLAAKKAVDAFRTRMEEYLACEKNFANIDAAQNELGKVADLFNLQIRAFKAKG